MNEALKEFGQSIKSLHGKNLELATSLCSNLELILKQIPSNIEIPLLQEILEDDVLVFEWFFDSRRIGFAFENDPEESCWFYADVRKNLIADSGLLMDLSAVQLKEIVERIIHPIQ